jgi:HEPN domain-containing protein
MATEKATKDGFPIATGAGRIHQGGKSRRIPNVQVWRHGREYVEAAEILFDYNRLLPAVILAALAIEIMLKSFLAERNGRGQSTTERGHGLTALFDRLAKRDTDDLLACWAEIEPGANLREALMKFDGTFTKARYFYEPDAPRVVSSDLVYLSRHVCEAAYMVAMKRGV